MENKRDYNRVLDSALSVLSNGGTLLYPTDTIWGVGCDATNATAIERVYSIKERDHSKSMLILCKDFDMVERFVGRVGDETAQMLLSEGRPTTVIMPLTENGHEVQNADKNCQLSIVNYQLSIAANLVASDGTIGVRIPRMEFCQRLLTLFGRPIVSTSANFSGCTSPRCYADIDPALFERVDYAVPSSFENPSDGSSSRIVKISPTGDIMIIRP